MLLMVCVCLLFGMIDFFIGAEYSFSVFYILPIMLATWYGSKVFGVSVAVLSSIIWLVSDSASGTNYSNIFIPIWNTSVRLGFFLIIFKLLVIVHEKLDFEESLADTDALTGLANRRFFQEQLEREYKRALRTLDSLTIAFIDLDDFKSVNDTRGHQVGDELLHTVAATLNTHVRATDFVARLGGDEFVLLLPTIKKESVLPTIEKLQRDLLAEMELHAWPVTFSVGVITFLEVMDSGKAMLKMVDDLMYEVKKSGKNNIRYIEWPEHQITKNRVGVE